MNLLGYPHGFLYQPENELILKFMFNPVEIDKKKSVLFDTRNIPGMDTPIITYTGGSDRSVSFKLFFDTTNQEINPSHGQVSLNRPFGVLQIEAVLESMALNYLGASSNKNIAESFASASAISDSGLSPKSFLNNASLRVFSPPPDVYFIFGFQWFKVKIKSCNFTERMFQKITMIPQQLETDLDLYVDESGVFHNTSIDEKTAMAKVESFTSITELSLDISNWAPAIGAISTLKSVSSI